ncbi:MAG: Type II secretion system protein E [Alphaproteobacteria bacterium ADurb.Bin438]|nr:MAG: Type II secretion system protein E [Alphaproteobacteria bacterium ADurb.Bin438]
MSLEEEKVNSLNDEEGKELEQDASKKENVEASSDQNSDTETQNEDSKKSEKKEEEKKPSPALASQEISIQNKFENVPKFVEELFGQGNECITSPNGSFPVKEDTRNLLALFANGRFLVCESHKFDGRVLSFEVLARKRRLQVGKPEYVPMSVINAIYDRSLKKDANVFTEAASAEDQEQMQMQKDFLMLIIRASAVKVSDIHIVIADHTTVYFRTNGMMQVEMEYNKEWGEAFVRSAFASADISDSNYAQNEYQAAQKDGRTPLRGSKGKLMLPKRVLGIRLQFNPIAFGTRYLIMRLLYADDDPSNSGSITALGYTEKEAELFFRLRAVPMGIIIVAGPTGSGKSTTLQRSMIQMLKERNYEINLITVEDPPEYPIPGARQMPVTNAPTEELKEREFTKALAASLRSDPDMLMIGEIRTLSAAQLAFKGALSGHGVWSTLHANTSPAVILRFRDMGVETFKLIDPELMKGMISQRLFRRLCPNCRVKATDALDHPAVQRLKKGYGEFGLEQSYLRGAGCPHCDYRGVRGRCVVGEILIPDATFLSLLVNGETKKAIDYWTGELGGRTMKDCAVERMMRGLLGIEEIERWCGLIDQKAVY